MSKIGRINMSGVNKVKHLNKYGIGYVADVNGRQQMTVKIFGIECSLLEFAFLAEHGPKVFAATDQNVSMRGHVLALHLKHHICEKI